VLSVIHEHVGERALDLARRGERDAVPAIAPDGALALERLVDGAREADDEPAHAAAERGGVARLDQHVHVIGLHGEVDDAECTPRAAAVGGPAERFADACEHPLPTKAADPRAERDMHRVLAAMRRPRAMRRARTRSLGRAAGAAARPAVGAVGERELLRPAGCHLEKAIIRSAPENKAISCSCRRLLGTHLRAEVVDSSAHTQGSTSTQRHLLNE
jgi:hypothetical protein